MTQRQITVAQARVNGGSLIESPNCSRLDEHGRIQRLWPTAFLTALSSRRAAERENEVVVLCTLTAFAKKPPN